MKEINKDLVIKFYEYFYAKRFNSLTYTFKPSDKASKAIDTFIKLLNKHYNTKTIGENFLWDYFIYQFNYWRDAKIQAFYGKFRVEYIIGKKAFLRFIDESKDDHWVITKSEIIKMYGFRKTDLIKPASKKPYQGTHEDKIKKLFFNTDRGMYNCIVNTTLYNDKSLLCQKCNFKDDCKQILKDKYPKIYRSRNY